MKSSAIDIALAHFARFFATIGLSVYLTGCGYPPTAPSDARLQNALFSSGRGPIEIGTPRNNCVVGPRPTFTWRATGQRLVHVGIFNETIDVRGGRVVNMQANIWAWHSGMGLGREGNVTFDQGVNVHDGSLQSGPPSPLEIGRGYMWAVWAWDESGTQVLHSSQETFFLVSANGPATCDE